MEESRYLRTGSKYYEKNLVIYIGRFFFLWLKYIKQRCTQNIVSVN